MRDKIRLPRKRKKALIQRDGRSEFYIRLDINRAAYDYNPNPRYRNFHDKEC